MQSDAIRELLEAASKGPWVAESNGWWHYIRTEDHDSVAAFEEYDQLLGQANVALAALAPDLAQEVLDLREVGEALAASLEHRRHCECCIEALHLCTEFQELSAAALARWADRHEEEDCDGRLHLHDG